MARPRISLCMIVRDEARMIEGCLSSVRGLVSEMIVVDTGSTDDTRERARRAGAKVVAATWTDDFSHARNISLKHATGEWLLILDADERLVVRDQARLERLLARATFDCALLRMNDAVSVDATLEDVLSGKARQGEPQRVPRLVRRDAHVQYAGVIHEDLGPWLVKYRKRVATIDLDIVHYGATQEIYVDRGKFERNARLLIAAAQKSPESPTALGYLAHQYLQAGQLAEAQQAVEEGWRRVPSVECATEFRPSILRLAEARAQLQLLAGDFSGALDTVHQTRRIEGNHYDLDYIEGYAFESMGAAEQHPRARSRFLNAARQCFETCLASKDDEYIHAFVAGATTWAGRLRLGSTHLLLGQWSRAAESFRTCLEHRPGEVEARLGLLEATLRDRGGADAMRMVGELLKDEAVRSTNDFWVLAAAACEELGALDDMAKFLAQARWQSPVYVASYRRRQHAERVAALALYRGSPVRAPGLVGAITGVVARSPVALSDNGAWPSSSAVVRTLVRNLASVGRLAQLEPLLEPRADVVVPGVTAHVRAAVEEQSINLEYEPPPTTIFVAGTDASFVCALLKTHAGIAGRVHELAEGGSTSNARVVVAGDHSGNGFSAVQRVSKRSLLEDPIMQADKLLAALGEGGADPLVRHLVEAYPAAVPTHAGSQVRLNSSALGLNAHPVTAHMDAVE